MEESPESNGFPPSRVVDFSPENQLKAYQATLSDQAVFLTPLCEKLVARWSELYLQTFGRRSFFSPQRVEKIFRELAEIYLGCLREKCLDLYLENLKERGRVFSGLKVPFEEVLVSLHLFEETCLEQFLSSYPDRSRLPELIIATEQLHHQGLAALAASYFETTKKEMQQITDSFREENESLHKELGENRDAYFSNTHKELASMQLLISGINHKLRNRVVQLSRIQKISDALDNESSPTKLLHQAGTQILSLCPPNSNVYFCLFDEERTKVHLYSQESRQTLECDIAQTFFFSELPRGFQDALYDETKKQIFFKGYSEIPGPLGEMAKPRNQRDFLMIPIRKYRDVKGFIFIATAEEDFFSKGTGKFYQRIGQAVSRAITTVMLFHQSKKRDEFASVLDELTRKKSENGPVEATLDFCLGSLINLLGAERSSLMRFDVSKQELKVCAAKGYKVYPISGTTIKWGEGIAGLSLKESKIISIPKLRDPGKAPLISRLLKENETHEIKIKSLICVPLFDAHRPLGVINVSTINFHRHFEKSDIEMVHQIAHRISSLLKDFS